MSNFLFAYNGGSMADTPEAQAEAMAAWGGWFAGLGAAVVDGGAPFGGSSTVAADGSTSAGSRSALTGYSIVTAGSLAEAHVLAKGCPVLSSGGSVEIYEALPM